MTDGEMSVRFPEGPDNRELVSGNLLERVRWCIDQPSTTMNGWRVHNNLPFGWSVWQYVWDVRLARGKIGPDIAAWGGQGFAQTSGAYPVGTSWYCLGAVPSKAVEAESWIDIPLEDQLVHVQDVELEPKSMTLKPGETRETKPVFTPSGATCKTGIWKVKPAGEENVCWIKPEMKDEIDPEEKRPVYSAEGSIMVHAGAPHRDPKATITFTTTDGKHTASCEVKVEAPE